MRVLILNCNTGTTPDPCTEALFVRLQERGVSCMAEDALTFLLDGAYRRLSPGAVRAYLNLSDALRAGRLTAGAERLYGYILQTGFDTVVCTHILAARMLTRVMLRHNRFLRTYFVTADYACPPQCRQSDLDAYFIPDECFVDDFIHSGIPSEKLMVSGIPIPKDFAPPADRGEAKRKLGMSIYTEHLLVVAGSRHCGPVEEVVRQLRSLLWNNARITVVCGRNIGLRSRLERWSQEDLRIRVQGAAPDLAALMDSADLLLTRAEGPLAALAAQKRLPMVFPAPAARHETGTMRYFTQKGVAISAEAPKALAALLHSLLSDQRLLGSMAEHYAGIPENKAAEHIVRHILAVDEERRNRL